ncbi:cell division protein FtsK, partial [Bacillus cereus]|nr:cell division protein FtsK [Bacillus cereus]
MDNLKLINYDKRKIQVFFDVSGIAIKKEEMLHNPKFHKTNIDDRSTTYM